ncbi:hypothetical protein [Variovorax paradoxus]|uniref:hypothetical protein n=1 Tax=Variovorax paradoxus TaxID=34073 RepID=UPI0027831619|nr:hypothetical protein [Variovorax paradoxus]MDP9932628.1 hypothetical protein [Variovorax paradoxus]
MDFSSRIKKEMTEGIVKAILEDAGYRVIDSGIEKVIRELSCLSSIEYGRLGYPDAMSHLPDFTVMNREQDQKFLVEVKYRKKWGKEIFEEVREQARMFGELTLVSINAAADDPSNINSPSRFIRCCGLKFDGEIYKVEIRRQQAPNAWIPCSEVNDGTGLWWAMTPLPDKFAKLKENAHAETLVKAVKALSGILDK